VLDGHLGYFVRRLQVWIFRLRAHAGRLRHPPGAYSVLVVIEANPGLSQADLAEPWASSGRGWCDCWTGWKCAA
jgi:hypothetical protein